MDDAVVGELTGVGRQICPVSMGKDEGWCFFYGNGKSFIVLLVINVRVTCTVIKTSMRKVLKYVF